MHFTVQRLLKFIAYFVSNSAPYMLHKIAMAGIVAWAKVPPSCIPALLAGSRYSLPVPYFHRSLTGGEIREAARNAKAHLLRATAAADASSAGKQFEAARSRFMDLSVDDRVVVNSLLCFPPYLSCLDTGVNSLPPLRELPYLNSGSPQ